MNTISIPLHKVFKWRIGCKCGGHVDIHSGIISGVEKAFCSKCKISVCLDNILPILQASRKLCVNHNRENDLSLIIRLDSCEEVV